MIFIRKSIFCLLAFYCLSASSNDRLRTSFPSKQKLVPKKGSGWVFSEIGFQKTNSRYDSSGNLVKLVSGNATTTFTEGIVLISGSYSFLDNWAFWMNFPVQYREENQTFDSNRIGIGDSSIGTRVLINSPAPNFQIAGNFGARFPSGNTNINFRNTDGSQKLKLPLGRGIVTLMPSLELQYRSKTISWVNYGRYELNLKSRVEYLQSALVGLPDSEGNIFLLPFSNFEIDWGDEIHGGSALAFHLSQRITVGLTGSFIYRFPTQINQIDLDTSVNPNGDFVLTKLSSSSSYLLIMGPFVEVFTSKGISVRASANLAALWGNGLYGKNYPISGLEFIESLVGDQYSVGVHYEF